MTKIQITINTPRDYKRIWDALTGKYFMYPTATLIGGMNYEKSNNE